MTLKKRSIEKSGQTGFCVTISLAKQNFCFLFEKEKQKNDIVKLNANLIIEGTFDMLQTVSFC